MDLFRLARRIHINEPSRILSIKNTEYQNALYDFMTPQLVWDHTRTDVTTQVVLGSKATHKAEAFVLSKARGVAAGIEEMSWFLTTHTPLSAVAKVKNGERISKGEVLLIVKGSLGDLMAYERMILNTIGHLSGIATQAAELVHKYPESIVSCTRKTRMGVFDKKACLVGGAGTHRLHLGDAVLIKHNHLHGITQDFEAMLEGSFKRAEKLSGIRFFEIEVTTTAQAKSAACFFSEHASARLPCVIMLDNFSPAQAKKLITELNQKFPHRSFLLECSGGITPRNLGDFTKTGADIFSLGALTHTTRFFDVSLRL